MFLVYIGFSLASKHRLKLSYIYETYSWAAPPFKGKLQMNLLWQRLWSKRSRIFINFIFCHIECYPENFGVKGRTTENWNMFAMVLRGCCKARVWFRKIDIFLKHLWESTKGEPNALNFNFGISNISSIFCVSRFS